MIHLGPLQWVGVPESKSYSAGNKGIRTMTFADLQQGVQTGVEQLKHQRALLQEMEAELQREYDSIFDELQEKKKALDEAIRHLSKPVRHFTSLEETSTKVAATPPAAPQRKKPGPKPGSKRKKATEVTPASTRRLRADEETIKEAVVVPPPKPAAPPAVETSSRPVEPAAEATKKPDAAPAKAKKGQLPPGVTLGRNGTPRLVESLTFILREYGPTHLDDIVKKMGDLNLLPKSDKPRAYIGYALSKNPQEFRPVGNKRGIWDLTKSYRAKIEASTTAPAPEASSEPEDEEADPEVAHLPNDVDLDGIRNMRAEEASADVSTERAAQIVEEMTDPKRNAAA